MSINSNILETWTVANVGTLRTFSRGPALTTTQYIYTALDASYRDYFYNNVRASTLVTRSSATGQIVGGSLTLTYTPTDNIAPTGSATIPRYTNNPIISVSASAADTGGSGMSKVSFPTWSNVNGQDDLVWHDIAGAGPNYYGTINLGNHSPGTDGDYSVHVYAYDNAGNNRNIGTQTVTLDRTAPYATSITWAPDWTNGDRSINVNFADSLSGISQVQYTYDKSSINVMANGGTLTWSSNTNATVWFRAVDYAGNYSNWDSYGPYYVRVDKTLPSSGAPQDGTYRYTNAASGTAIAVNVAGASDALSGVAGIYMWVSTDGGVSWNVVSGQLLSTWYNSSNGTYSGYGTFTITGEGTYLIRTHAVDNAGNWNWNDGGTEYVVVDRTAPPSPSATISITSNGANSGTNNISISWPAVSGATSYGLYIFDGINYRYHNIGNVTSWNSNSANIYPTQAQINAWATSTDPFRWGGDGQDWKASSNELYTKAAGGYTGYSYYTWIHIVSLDSLGNISGSPWAGATSLCSTTVDTDAPNIPSVPIIGTVTGTTIPVSVATVTDKYMTANFPGTGVSASTGYRFKIGTTESTWGAASTTWTVLTPNTVYTISAQTQDGNGNYSTYGTTTTVRTLANIPASLSATDGTSANSITITWGANSNPAGTTYELQMSTDQSNWSTIYTGTGLTYTHSGLTYNQTRYYRVRAKNADNIYTNYTSNEIGSTILDTTAPTITISPNGGTEANTRSVTVTVLDVGGSGLLASNSYQYQLGTSNTVAPTGTWITYTSGTNFTIGTGLNGTFYLWVKQISDNAGNLSVASIGNYTVSNAYIFDNIEPTVTIGSPSKTMAKSGDTVTYTITLSETLTFDIAKVVLSGTVTTGASVEITGSGVNYTATVTVGNGDGTLGINVNAGAITDAAGNVSSAKTGTTFIVDNTAPTIGSITAPSIINTPSGGTVTIILNGLQDLGGSGLKEAQFCPYIYKTDQWLTGETIAITGSSVSYDLPITEDGRYAVGVYVRDNVLNSNFQYVYITIDRGGLPPLINISPNGYSWSKEKNVTISVIDIGGKGLSINNSYQFYLSTSNQELRGGSWTNYTPGTQFTIGSGLSGIYYLWVKEISDLVGNKSSAISQAFYFDNTAPSASNILSNGSNIITITAIDEGSGVSNIELPDGTIKSGAVASYNVEASGTYKFIIKDKVGNSFEYFVECIINKWDKPIVNIIYDSSVTNDASRNMTISIDSINPIRMITINDFNIDLVDAIVNIIDGKYNTKVTYTITNNGIYKIVATDEKDNVGYNEIIINNFDRSAPKVTVTYNEPNIYSIYASIKFEADEKVIVVNQNNITDLIIPGMSEYTVSHEIEKVLANIKNGTVTFSDMAGNETVVNVEIDTIKHEYVRIGVDRVKAYDNLSIKSSYILAQQMENKIKLSSGKVSKYYGVNASEVDMFMSRSRDIGAVAYLAYAKGARNIEENTSGIPIGEDYKINTNQSTTGNIYGIFDLNGGQDEYNAFYVNSNQPILSENGNVLQNADNKYKDVISPSGVITIQDKLRLYKGIAITETSNFNGVNGIMPTTTLPFIKRNGLFDYKASSGETSSNSTFRVTLINK